MGVLSALEPEEVVRIPETGVIDSQGLPCGCWKLNLGSLQEQQVFVTTKPSLKPSDKPVLKF